MHKYYFLAKPGKNKSKIVLQVEVLGIYTRTWWVAAEIYEHIRSLQQAERRVACCPR